MACTFGHLKNGEVGADVDVADAIAGAANSEQAARAVLSALCRGDALFLNGELLPTASARCCTTSFYPCTRRRIARARRSASRACARLPSGDAYKGRKRKPMDELVLREVVSSYEARELDAEEAAARLGVSVSTFFRRLKELRLQG